MKYNFLVLGGGTAGYITALMIKAAYPEKSVALIKSEKIGIIGVGEGSTKEFTQFLNFIGVKPYDILKHTGATFKSGIFFEDWSDKKFLHTRSSFHDKTWLKIKPYYLFHIGNDLSDSFSQIPLCDKCYFNNQFYPNFLENPNQSPVNQYHFDTFKLNNYFYQLAIEREIHIIDDEITKINETNEINFIQGEKKYQADFYFDCTGFKRILNKSNWIGYSDKLICNKAVAFQTEKMPEYNAWTLAKKYKGGWRWQIPTQDRTGNGVVYNDSLIDDEIKKLIDNGKREFDFYPGRLQNIWNKNCLSVGLSAMFVEPLEATSIGSTINQIFMFLDTYPSSNNRETYNNSINKVFDQLVEFIQLHYLNTELNGDLSNELREKLRQWKNNLPREEDVNVSYGLFEVGNYIEVLYGLNYFNTNVIKNVFENLPVNLKNKVVKDTDDFIAFNDKSPKIGHKKAIDLILEHY
jgi:tryptophan halogenase